MPAYNEEEFVAASIQRVLGAPLPAGVHLELVVVDDGSTDRTRCTVEELAARHPESIRFLRHASNRGKGAAVRTAIEAARGEFGIIQDADLEYDPAEYPKLLAPLLAGRADAVFGSRFASAGERRVLYFWHALANQLLTTFCNAVADLNLTDIETCYKAFRISLVRSIPLRSDRFGIEPELTIKLAQRQACLYEVPVSYYGRTYEEGKKIGLRDAAAAFYSVLRWGLARDIYIDPGARILDRLARTPSFNRWMAGEVVPALGASVLEIGAGIGNLTRYLAPGRKRYVATDHDEEHLARLRVAFHGRPNVTVARCDLSRPEDFAPYAGQMDSVVCLNVLEHVADDVAALRNIHSALAPEGVAVILVPQGQTIYGSLDRVLGHYRRYSEPELRRKMERAGFDVTGVREFNRVTRPVWIWNGMVLKSSTFSRFQLLVFDRLVWLWRRLDRFCPWGAVSLIAAGRKR